MMQMKVANQWWWNNSFEGLMGNVEEWLGANEGIQIVHTDWKYVPEHDKFYMIILYKPPG